MTALANVTRNVTRIVLVNATKAKNAQEKIALAHATKNVTKLVLVNATKNVQKIVTADVKINLVTITATADARKKINQKKLNVIAINKISNLPFLDYNF